MLSTKSDTLNVRKGHDAALQILPAQVFQNCGLVMISESIKKFTACFPRMSCDFSLSLLFTALSGLENTTENVLMDLAKIFFNETRSQTGSVEGVRCSEF